MAAGVTGFECRRMAVGPELPAGMAGDQPLLEIPEHPAGESADDGAEGAGREDPAWVGQVVVADFPIDDVSAAGAEAAERQVFEFFIAQLQDGALK